MKHQQAQTRADKPVTRISYSSVRERGKIRDVVVTIHGTWLEFRLRGTPKRYQLDIAGAYHRAAALEGERMRAEKRAARLAKKGKSK